MFNKLDLEQEQQEESIPVASEHGTNRHSSSDKKIYQN